LLVTLEDFLASLHLLSVKFEEAARSILICSRHEDDMTCVKVKKTERKGRAKGSSAKASLLSSERAALGQTSLASGRLAEHGRAASADYYSLCVREDGGDCEATGALDVHEERAGSRDKVLELVLASLSGRGRVEKINCENHLDGFES